MTADGVQDDLYLPTGRVPMRRTDREKVQAGDYYDGNKRYYDQIAEITVIKLFSGECYVTSEPGEMIATILGSCVSACIRDPIAGVGGMNHFLLPGSSNISREESMRFGAFAMEQLINELLKIGGKKERFEVKVFGGGNVIESSAKIGDKNAIFVREYLKREGLRIHAEDLGGTLPRRIHYFPENGKIMMRKLKRKDDLRIIEEEKRFEVQAEHTAHDGGDVELFG